MKIVVGLSGGFDSFMACYILVTKGHDVTGVTMKLWDGDLSCKTKKNACYGPDEEDIEHAKKITEMLSIPHHVIDLSKEYKEYVLRYFIMEYASGKTPNPCVVCNSKIKFGFLLERIRSLGIHFDYFATGHYARIEYDSEKGRYLLKRGLDIHKDQSYFLYRLTQDQLKQILFPLGRFCKKELKTLAMAKGFHDIAKRPESQDFFCSDYSIILKDQVKPGNILDLDGKVIGTHKGICHYTIGQRRYLNLAGLKEPFYVIKINAEKNEIVAGPKRYLLKRFLLAKDLNWIVPIEEIKEKRLYAQIRYKTKPAECKVSQRENGVLVEFLSPQEGIAPGQSVVFYDGDILVGGGVIDSNSS
ncbi:MAG: tRNA 2-thiouridine(34) synthase MnmA [Deltaproteobacteria bacterium]|nr:tRNA 2-thiouridine(34) synthase MnmA [Deltaproteobacteria bacterium]